MVSALGIRASGPGSNLARGHRVVFLGKTRTLTVPFSLYAAQVYKWVEGNLMLGVTLRWTSIPYRGVGVEILLVAS